MYHFDHVPIPTIVDLLNNISESPKNLPPLTATRLSPQTHPCPIWRICTVWRSFSSALPPHSGYSECGFYPTSDCRSFAGVCTTRNDVTVCNTTYPMVWAVGKHCNLQLIDFVGCYKTFIESVHVSTCQ